MKDTKKHVELKRNSYYLSPKDFNHQNSSEDSSFFCEEQLILTYKRWKKIENDFFNKKDSCYDISKIPDVHYSIQYDILHNKHFQELNKEATQELLECSYKLAKFVIPGEYGLSPREKVEMGKLVRKRDLISYYWDIGV